MKKKILSFLLILCLMLPFSATMLTACGDDEDDSHDCKASTEWTSNDTHHWHTCTETDCDEILDKAEHDFETTTQDATIDEDGKTTKVCSVCNKTIETIIPKRVQTKNEMIAVLASAVRKENYTSEIQEIYYYEKTSDNSMIAAADTPEKETVYFAKKSDGTLVKYNINHNKPEGFEGDYITDIEYVKTVEPDVILHSLYLDKTSNELELQEKTRVGDNYSKNYTISNINESLDYFLEINSEETMNSVLKDTLAFYVDIYQRRLASKSIIFNYNKEDIVDTTEVTYASGVYTAVGSIMLSEDKITYQGEPPLKIKDFKVEFEVEYTNDLVKRNDSKFIYNVEQGGNTEELYIINNFSYSKTAESTHFSLAEEMLSELESTYEGSISDKNETLTVYLNNKLYATTDIKFGTAINATLDLILLELAEMEEYSTITTTINGEAYDAQNNVIIEDYSGTSVYITILPNEGYTLIMTSYILVEQTYDFEIYRTNVLQMVETNSGLYTIITNGPNPDYDEELNPTAPETVPYTDQMTLNDETITNTPEDLTFEVVENAYYVELVLYVDLGLGE